MRVEFPGRNLAPGVSRWHCGCSENAEAGVSQLKGLSARGALPESEMWLSQRDFIHLQQIKEIHIRSSVALKGGLAIA